MLVPADRQDLVDEIVDVARLYSSAYGGDFEDRQRARQAQGLIKRACKWLQEVLK